MIGYIVIKSDDNCPYKEGLYTNIEILCIQHF